MEFEADFENYFDDNYDHEEFGFEDDAVYENFDDDEMVGGMPGDGNVEEQQVNSDYHQPNDDVVTTELVNNIQFANMITGDARLTRDVMTVYEANMAIAYRADQIEQAADSANYIKKEDLERLQQENPQLQMILDSPLKIAFIEFITRRSPMKLLRKKGVDYEVWSVREMIQPQMNNLTLEIIFA